MPIKTKKLKYKAQPKSKAKKPTKKKPVKAGKAVVMIKKQGSQYVLKSKKTGKSLGKFPSKKAAEKRERQIQFFKHKK